MKPLTAPTIETDRLRLRAIEMADFPTMRSFYETDRSKYVGGPLAANDAWYAFSADPGQWVFLGFGAFSIDLKDTGEFVGQVFLNKPPHFPETEIGWILWDGFEGKGYATEAATAARKYAYDVAGWTSAVSYIAKEHTGSIKVAERLGAVLDPDAATPGHKTTIAVYRHPTAEALR